MPNMTDKENEIQPAAEPVAAPASSAAAESAPANPSPRALVVEDSTPSAGLAEDSSPSAGLAEDSTPSVATVEDSTPIAAFAESQPVVESNGRASVEARKLPEIQAEAQRNGKEPEKNGKELQEAGDFKNVSEAEGQQKKLPYPKSVFFIISNEFCERFNYYGMRTVLVLYLSRALHYSDDTATVVFHVFTMFVYFLCVFGAIISDSWLGKFKTILYLSLVYICGSVLLTLGAIGPLNLPVETFTMLGLALIALGSGGIKPCVSAFGGDQFKVPEQVKQITSFFSLFYFSINAGSLISTTVTPILREDVSCFNDINCYPLAFGVPAVLMIVSVIIFVLGRSLYKMKPPAGNMVVLVSSTIWTAITTKCKEKKTNPREHWLDYADVKYDRQLIDDVKVLMRVLFLYLPLPVFWALFDQQGSRWTFQATRMDGDMGTWDIKPDQLQVLNPLLILLFIPLYDVAFYPALRLVGISRPLQKLTMGGILAGIAFIISGVVELNLEKTYPDLPYSQNIQLRIFNTDNCDYTFTSNLTGVESVTVPPLSAYTNKDLHVGHSVDLVYYLNSTNPDCTINVAGEKITLSEKKAWSLFLSPENATTTHYWEEDFVDKPSESRPLIRNVANLPPTDRITWRTTGKDEEVYNELAAETNLTRVNSGEYYVMVGEMWVGRYHVHTGGVYTLLISDKHAGSLVEITEPNSMNILWLVPQYVIMTLGEVMFSVTGLEFSYAQAPPSMKSVLQACWLLTVAFGNVIVVIIAEAALFDSQASEFFLFAGLMFADMLIFMLMAYYYVPNDPNKLVEEAQPLTVGDAKAEIPPLEGGVENKGKDIDE
ncbi:peptide transporter family 1 isoform X2 [Drosophila biarmipes]|uniref:peptide transporter family 1 isoform X2 n=1 Tax=Drosophila biarmipes TaxID=125945 RepID=UPI0007E8B532|nr:peptide transporter family 1 isoform X2 [Drosophila biarmipes]XP_043948761.1 peptide transporter family 1 isoform X2 [Drosophila biarmipes]